MEGANISITRQAREFKEVLENGTRGASVKGRAVLFYLPSVIESSVSPIKKPHVHIQKSRIIDY